MWKTEKKINKILIWAIIGSAVLGVGGLSMTPKWKSFWRRMLRKSKGWTSFFLRGVSQMKKDFFGKETIKKLRDKRIRRRSKDTK
jgi:hypothetical protein